MSKTDFLENRLLDHTTGVAAYTAPAALWIGLSSTAPTEAGGNITEPSGGGYARVSSAGKWAAASGGSTSNNAEIAFAESTGAWLSGANLTHFVVFDASTTGNALRFGTLATPRSVGAAGVTLRFNSGSLTMTED